MADDYDALGEEDANASANDTFVGTYQAENAPGPACR